MCFIPREWTHSRRVRALNTHTHTHTYVHIHTQRGTHTLMISCCYRSLLHARYHRYRYCHCLAPSSSSLYLFTLKLFFSPPFVPRCARNEHIQNETLWKKKKKRKKRKNEKPWTKKKTKTSTRLTLVPSLKRTRIKHLFTLRLFLLCTLYLNAFQLAKTI